MYMNKSAKGGGDPDLIFTYFTLLFLCVYPNSNNFIDAFTFPITHIMKTVTFLAVVIGGYKRKECSLTLSGKSSFY